MPSFFYGCFSDSDNPYYTSLANRQKKLRTLTQNVLQALGACQNLKTADLLGEKILIGVIYRKEETRCRELK
jgi:hypothetical protein